MSDEGKSTKLVPLLLGLLILMQAGQLLLTAPQYLCSMIPSPAPRISVSEKMDTIVCVIQPVVHEFGLFTVSSYPEEVELLPAVLDSSGEGGLLLKVTSENGNDYYYPLAAWLEQPVDVYRGEFLVASWRPRIVPATDPARL